MKVKITYIIYSCNFMRFVLQISKNYTISQNSLICQPQAQPKHKMKAKSLQ